MLVGGELGDGVDEGLGLHGAELALAEDVLRGVVGTVEAILAQHIEVAVLIGLVVGT